VTTERYGSLKVPVAGGDLHVGAWGSGDVVALALHGVTFTHAEFDLLGEMLADCGRVLAPDLRGRGASADLGPPYGIDANVADVAEVLRQQAGGPVVLVGHSWGASVALVVAHRHPELVRGVLLVDGGLPPRRGPDSEAATLKSIERVTERLGRSFASVEEYLAPWRVHPGLLSYWNGYIERALAYELVGTPPALRCSLRAEALAADLTSTYIEGDRVERALLGLRCRVTLIRTARDMGDQDDPQYSDAVVQDWRARVDGLEDVFAGDENHYTIMLRPSGAALVADMVRRMSPTPACGSGQAR
jgi:lipase